MRSVLVIFLVLLASGLLAIDVSTVAARSHRLADGLTSFRLQYLMAAAGLLVSLLLVGGRGGGVRWSRWGMAIVMVHQVYWILPTLRLRVAPEPAFVHEVQSSVLAFNVLHSNQDTEKTLAYVRQVDAEVLGFFESIKHWPEALLELADTWPYHLRIDALEMELYSKHEIASNQVYRFGQRRGFVACDLMIKGTPVTVLINHPYPPISLGEQAYQWRNEQLHALGKAFAQHADPLVVIGDFNASPWSPVMLDLEAETGWKRALPRWSPRGTHALVAPETWLFAQPIDHALVNEQVRPLDMVIGPYLGSDHRPLVIDFAVQRNGSHAEIATK